MQPLKGFRHTASGQGKLAVNNSVVCGAYSSLYLILHLSLNFYKELLLLFSAVASHFWREIMFKTWDCSPAEIYSLTPPCAIFNKQAEFPGCGVVSIRASSPYDSNFSVRVTACLSFPYLPQSGQSAKKWHAIFQPLHPSWFDPWWKRHWENYYPLLLRDEVFCLLAWSILFLSQGPIILLGLKLST